MTYRLRRLPAERPIFLFLDYDGTLAAIRNTPREAGLSAARRAVLRRLSRKMFVCIVSGRSLDDVKAMVRLASVAAIGNHGLEIECGSRRWTHPEARPVRAELRRVLDKIGRRLDRLPGLIVEDKGLTGSVHYRRVPPAAWAEVETVVREEVGRSRSALRMTKGHRVHEIRPRVAWDKGRGVRYFLARLETGTRPLVVYIGDDETDEDAFRTLRRKGITIRVGGKGRTLARYRLGTVREVWTLLRRLEKETIIRPS